MELRSLACRREVGFHYDIPLTREQRFSEPYADPKVVAVIGFCISQVRDAISEKYDREIKIDAQLDYNHGYDGLGRDQVIGYNFDVGFDRTDKEKVPFANLEKAVLEFLEMIPLKPVVGGAPTNLFERIKGYEPKELVA